MGPCRSLVVYRGEDVGDAVLRDVTREVLGAHLRPDADVGFVASAPVRIDRTARGSADPTAGTVRAVRWVLPKGAEAPWTAVSAFAMRARLGVPESARDEATPYFANVAHEALAARLSEEVGPVVAVSVWDDPPLGGYALFAQGRRLWSARYQPGQHYASWDGDEVRVEPMALEDPPPPEGAHGDFPCHGVLLLFREPVELTWNERIHMLASLTRAAHQPASSARGLVAIEDGRVLPSARGFTEADWARFVVGIDEATPG